MLLLLLVALEDLVDGHAVELSGGRWGDGRTPRGARIRILRIGRRLGLLGMATAVLGIRDMRMVVLLL